MGCAYSVPVTHGGAWEPWETSAKCVLLEETGSRRYTILSLQYMICHLTPPTLGSDHGWSSRNVCSMDQNHKKEKTAHSANASFPWISPNNCPSLSSGIFYPKAPSFPHSKMISALWRYFTPSWFSFRIKENDFSISYVEKWDSLLST